MIPLSVYPSDHQRRSPSSRRVKITRIPFTSSDAVSAAQFAGIATRGEVQRQLTALRAALVHDGVEVEEPPLHRVFLYNPPGTVPFLRRNELAVRVTLPGSGEDEE